MNYKVYRFLFIKISTFCQKSLTNHPEFAAMPIEYILFFRLESIFCCLLILADMPPIKPLLLQISVNIILSQMPFQQLHGISLKVSGLMIFLTSDELLCSKYSVFGPKPRIPFRMHRSNLMSID